jgi:hypothetical protein
MTKTCKLASKFMDQVLCKQEVDSGEAKKMNRRIEKRPELAIGFLEEAFPRAAIRVTETRFFLNHKGDYDYMDEVETSQLLSDYAEEQKGKASQVVLFIRLEVYDEPDNNPIKSDWVVLVIDRERLKVWFYDPHDQSRKEGQLSSRLLALAVPFQDQYKLSMKNDDYKATANPDSSLAWCSLYAYLRLHCPDDPGHFFFVNPRRQQAMISNWLCLMHG